MSDPAVPSQALPPPRPATLLTARRRWPGTAKGTAGLRALLLAVAGHREKQQARPGELHRPRSQLQDALDARPAPAGQATHALAGQRFVEHLTALTEADEHRPRL